MGFLDHSTNNIIIDAVLTDYGREVLASNAGFSITMFSLGDDEVDYTIIEKYGRAVGKEKISKNTPVFEAQTKGNLAIKHRLLTIPDSYVTSLPTMSLSSTDLTDNTITIGAAGESTVTVTLKMQGLKQWPTGLNDDSFTVLVPDRFAVLQGENFLDVMPTTRIASYSISTSDDTGNTSSVSAQFTIAKHSSLDETTFSIYGDSDNKNQITSVVSVIGEQSGTRLDFRLVIKKNNIL